VAQIVEGKERNDKGVPRPSQSMKADDRIWSQWHLKLEAVIWGCLCSVLVRNVVELTSVDHQADSLQSFMSTNTALSIHDLG
jgi:hypothetical protein